MIKPDKIPVLYINGWGDGVTKLSERALLTTLRWRGYSRWHAHINWLSDDTSEDYIEETTELAKGLLSAKGRLAMIGSNEGGDLAVSILSKLSPSKDVWAINLGGQVSEELELTTNQKARIKSVQGMSVVKTSILLPHMIQRMAEAKPRQDA